MIQAAIAAASVGLSVLGHLFGASTAKKQARAKANQLMEAAQQSKAEAGAAAQVQLEQGDRLAARGATLAAASGGGTGGSALGVLDDVTRQSIYNARVSLYKGSTQAHTYNLEAKQALDAGRAQQIGELIGAGTSLLAGFGKMAEAGRTNSMLRGMDGGGGGSGGDSSGGGDSGGGGGDSGGGGGGGGGD